MMKAWSVTIKTWAGMVGIYAAQTRGRAVKAAWRGCNEAGYTIGWPEFECRRAPKFDDLAAQTEKVGTCLGWSQESDGTTWGCLRSVEEHMRHLIGLALMRAQLELRFHENSHTNEPTAILGIVASITWLDELQKYRVFEPANPQRRTTDFAKSADVVDYLKGLTS